MKRDLGRQLAAAQGPAPRGLQPSLPRPWRPEGLSLHPTFALSSCCTLMGSRSSSGAMSSRLALAR